LKLEKTNVEVKNYKLTGNSFNYCLGMSIFIIHNLLDNDLYVDSYDESSS